MFPSLETWLFNFQSPFIPNPPFIHGHSVSVRFYLLNPYFYLVSFSFVDTSWFCCLENWSAILLLTFALFVDFTSTGDLVTIRPHYLLNNYSWYHSHLYLPLKLSFHFQLVFFHLFFFWWSPKELKWNRYTHPTFTPSLHGLLNIACSPCFKPQS